MIRIGIILSILLFSLPISCSSAVVATRESSALVTIKTDKDSYFPYEEVKVIIYNGLSETIEYYGSCSLTTCQSIDGDWVCAIRDCFAPKDILASGSSTEFNEIFTGSAEEVFRYQFEYFLPSAEALHTVYSNEFFVKP
jgi:hypothetical protein